MARRFLIAFSYASEKRSFVGEVADILAGQFSKEQILYDKFHEAEFARHDLGVILPQLYGEESELVVPVVCPAYDVKTWTGWEWGHICGLLTTADGHRVMLCRFSKAEVKGLGPTAAYIELDGKTSEQVAALILERLALNQGKPKDEYAKPNNPGGKALSTATPNNLPRLQPFFGRAAELQTLREALDPGAHGWGMVIDGPGGMGKTSLAVRAAYDCPPGLFQRIIFVSLKDREMRESGERRAGHFLIPDFPAMLNEIARELGQPDIARAPEDERIRLLLDALRSAQALLVLDNLESLRRSDCDQLFSFLERLPQRCKALLTSRSRVGSIAETLILDKLDQDAALATLADLAKRSPLLARTSEAERIALYRQTDGKPLLLRWVAGQLGRGSFTTFRHALAFLHSCPPENDPLEFIFGDLAKEFTAAEEKVLCALTYFSFPTHQEHIAEFACLAQETVEVALRTLAIRALVVPDQEEEHYTLVPMVADFLRRHRPAVIEELASQPEKLAYALIEDNGHQRHERFSVLEEAWPTVASALQFYKAGPNLQLQNVCSSLRFFLEFSGRWEVWGDLCRHAEEVARQKNDRAHAGKRALQMGWFHYRKKEADEILACATRAARHWQIEGGESPGAKDSTYERASVLLMRGLGYRVMKAYDKSLESFREALAMFRQVSPESVEVAICLNGVGTAARHAGDLDAAERNVQEALSRALRINFREGIASYTSGLARIAIAREDWPRAESLSREALPLSEAVRRDELIARACHRLAIALCRQGKAEEACQYAQRAVEIYTRLRSPSLDAALATLRECKGDAGA